MTAYPIPDEALDDRLGIVGTSGAGKTYTAMGAVERLLASGARCVIVDPLDVWWGLRLSADGERASKFKLPILGGSHGDLPLTENSGALIGETVSGMADSCIVSLGGFSSGAAERRFMLAFLNALYRRSSGSLFHLVLDEADLWAPQQVLDKDGGSMQLKGVVEGIVRRGRVKGFIPWLITQRPAVIDKSVMSMMVGLIAMKAMSPQDRDAILAWLKGQMTAEQRGELDAAMPQLNIGEGVVWIPGHNVLRRAQFPVKATFDSSRAPKRGEAVAALALKALDLGALQERLSTVEAEVLANDPKALKAEIARLKAEAGKVKPAAPDERQIEAAEQRGYAQGYSAGFEDSSQKAWVRANEIISDAGLALSAAREADWNKSRTVGHAPPAGAMSVSAPSPAVKKIDTPAPRTAPPPRPAAAPAASDGDLTGPQRTVLRSLAWWARMGKERPTRNQVAIMCGWSTNSSNIRDRCSELARAGMIDRPEPGRLQLTDAGAQAAPDPGAEGSLHENIRAVLKGPQTQVFNALLAVGGPVHRDQVAEACGWSTNSSNIRDRLSELARLDIIERPGPGLVALQPWVNE